MRPSRDVAAPQAALARRLRQLREEQWPDIEVTQPMVGQALGGGKPLAASTISSWESLSSPLLPPPRRLVAYATLFATRRSVDGGQLRLLPEQELTDAERIARQDLLTELMALRAAAEDGAEPASAATGNSWHFPDGAPVRLICGALPEEYWSSMALPDHLNYTELLSYADLDALVELFGHIRAQNPSSDVRFIRVDEVTADDLSTHVVLLGGLSHEKRVALMLASDSGLPVQQVADPDLIKKDPRFDEGEIFVLTENTERRFLPVFDDDTGGLQEDVGLLLRDRNPNNSARTLTICSGVYAPGVLGAVRCLTDSRLRAGNENYLARRFPDATRFGLLVRVRYQVPLTLTPDLSNPGTRLFEWP